MTLVQSIDSSRNPTTSFSQHWPIRLNNVDFYSSNNECHVTQNKAQNNKFNDIDPTWNSSILFIILL